MTSVAQRVWGWVRPSLSYRAGEGKRGPGECTTTNCDPKGNWGLGGVISWVWGPKEKVYHKVPTEEYWEAAERLQPMEVEDLGAGSPECDGEPPAKIPSRWWHTVLPTSYMPWPQLTISPGGLRQRKTAGWGEGLWDKDKADGDLSDYGTPPPSPTPLQKAAESSFSVFSRTWGGEVLPEHFDICFNFLRHLFDLCVVGLLWAVSLPARVFLDILGVQGALKLWLHGMAMFFVSSVGMAALLWVIQEFLPQFALVYGIIQGLVISVSVRQSVITGEGEQPEDQEQQSEQQGLEEKREEKPESDKLELKPSIQDSSKRKTRIK